MLAKWVIEDEYGGSMGGQIRRRLGHSKVLLVLTLAGRLMAARVVEDKGGGDLVGCVGGVGLCK